MQRRALAALVLGALLPACGTTLFEGRREQRADEWTVTLTKFRDGPNRWETGGRIAYVPADGERFLWAVVTVRNEAATPRLVDFSGCGVDVGDRLALAVIVTHDLFINTNIGSKETIRPGEAITRKLGFSYPKDRLPTLVECAGVTVPIPAG